MKTLGQIAYEADCVFHKVHPDATYSDKDRWDAIAAAVAEEAVRRMADAVVEGAKVFRPGSHN